MTPKEIAIVFLTQIIEGNIDQAFEKYTASDFKHHNVYFKEDASSIIDGMKENHNQFPNKSINFHSVFQEDQKVITHAFLSLGQDNPGVQMIHIFRFENGKIAEMWDCAQPLPPSSPNMLGAF